MAKDKADDVAVVDPNVTVRDEGLEAEPDAGLTQDMLYGGTKPKGTPPAEPAEPAAKPKDKPADAAADTKVKPKPDKPPAEPDAKAVAAAQQEKWDAERQRSDQGHATERRALEGQVVAMKEQVATLQTQLTAAAQAKPEDDDTKRRLASLERLDDQMANLTGESDPSAVAGVMRTMGGLLADFMATPTATSAIDASQIQEIVDRIGKIETGFQNLSAETAAFFSETALEGLLKKFDNEFGAQHHNAALAEAKKVLKAAGRTQEEPPNPFETELVLRNAYMAEAAGDKKPGDMPKGKAGALPGDSGAGGTATPFATGPSGTLREVLDDKLKKGEVR